MHMTSRTILKTGLFAGLALCLQIASTQIQLAAQQPAAQAGPAAGQAGARGGGRGAVDPRVQQRTYLFNDTMEELPYAVFVSSKVSKDKKNPLIVALHGLNGNPNTLMRPNALQAAEEGGYILVGPMGYNTGGWYGTPYGRGGRGRGANVDGANPAAGTQQRGGADGANPAGAAQRGAGGRGGALGGGVRGGGTAVTDAARVTELSEKDVMNVLAMIRKEFNIDERRTYLMGHSMGGAGAIYLGVKYVSNWAAIGAFAPATAPAGLNPDSFSLEPAKSVPVIIVQGDNDTLVPVAGTRRWIDKMKELNMTHQYVETAGGTHESVVNTGMPDVFAFFAKHSK
jgi:poly(3-hydroxybutyrate) depolymerase